eukprot:3863878-Pyramimonas_sp.AAC.1
MAQTAFVSPTQYSASSRHKGSAEGPVAQSACVSVTQYSALWPHREPHRGSPWRSPHTSPSPTTPLRGPICFARILIHGQTHRA